MTIRKAWEKKKAAQASAQAFARSGETVAPNGRQSGKLKKLFSKTSMAIAATTMLTAAVAATTGQGSGSDCDISCNTASGETPCIYSNSKTGVCQRTCCPAGSSCFQKTETKVVEVGDGNFDYINELTAFCCDTGPKDDCPKPPTTGLRRGIGY